MPFYRSYFFQLLILNPGIRLKWLSLLVTKVISFSIATPAINRSMSSIIVPDCLSVEYISAEILTDFSDRGIMIFSDTNSSNMLNCLKAFFANKPLVISCKLLRIFQLNHNIQGISQNSFLHWGRP